MLSHDRYDESLDLPAPQATSVDFVLLHQQAKQIAAQLRTRKEDIERREAELSQQLAEFNHDMRQARLWLDNEREELSDRDEEVNQRQRALDRRINWLLKVDDPDAFAPADEDDADDELLDGRLAAIAELMRRWHAERLALNVGRDELRLDRERLNDERRQVEQELTTQRENALRNVHAALEQIEKHRESLDRREETFKTEHDEWLRRRSELSTAHAQLDEQLQHRQAQLLDREQWLLDAEQKYAEACLQLQHEAAALVAEREQVASQARIDRQRLAEEYRGREQELLARRQIVERESEEIDSRRAALEREHDEVMQQHRETLELRLATEELWTQMSGEIPSARVTRALNQTRQRLADHYQCETTEIDRRQIELDETRSSIGEQLELLAQRNEQLQSWWSSRQAQVDQQAAALVAREQQLDQQANEYRQAQQRAQHERMQLEQEIRRLAGELRIQTLRFA